ncbi:hypothetical protein EJ03DRAFT_6750 [Teratosphaeria nubilosa]|uniref:Uncharacterized protein n=1 Tax=Teratosphaeria nubilosa TaxID=161662 RepID=A0A6G1LNB2_9PEZI|nr:hypothetical protein EJ03DRAFT_6750 [Teratosphaeria nubilosa]
MIADVSKSKSSLSTAPLLCYSCTAMGLTLLARHCFHSLEQDSIYNSISILLAPERTEWILEQIVVVDLIPRSRR